MRSKRLVAGAVLTAACAVVAGGAGATPTTFTLTFDGHHTADTSLPAGLRHEGPFTASAPACPAGTAKDVADVVVEPLTVLRTFECADGSGSFTVLLPSVASEHGGSSTWRIVRGTGKYELLRGSGTYQSTLVSGSPTDFGSITYHSTWTGIVDYDVAPPTIQVAARATRLRRPVGTYTVRVGLSLLNEAAGAKTTYVLEVFAGRASLTLRLGSTTTGHATLNLRLHPPKTARRLRLQVRATDVVGNESTAARMIALPPAP